MSGFQTGISEHFYMCTSVLVMNEFLELYSLVQNIVADMVKIKAHLQADDRKPEYCWSHVNDMNE